MSKVTPDDPRYPTLVRGFNLRWVGTPSYVQVCSETQEVVDAVQLAVDSGLRVTVQSGGHCYENFAVGNTGGVIIDMARVNQGYYHDEAQAFWFVAGCARGDL